MTGKTIWGAVIVGAGMLLATIVGGRASAIGKAQSPMRMQANIQVDLGSGFSYQGFVQNNGSPINDSCDFTFALFDAATGGAQVGATETETNMMVNEGRFAIQLNEAGQFGTDAFVGNARWLEVAVRCPAGSGSYMTLGPRQALTASPYALSLQPGAVISGSVSSGILHVRNSSGDALSVGTAGDDGLQVFSTVDDGVYVQFAGSDGVQVETAGNPSDVIPSLENNGVEIVGAEGHGLWVGRADESGVLVNSAGADGLLVLSAAGDGVEVFTSGDDGVYVQFASGDGVQVEAAGSPSTAIPSSENNGVEVAGAEGHGLWVGRADDSGLLVNSAGADGALVLSAADDGMEVFTSGDDGVYVQFAGSDGVQVETAGNPSDVIPSLENNGVEVVGAEGSGLYVGRADNDAVRINSTGYSGIHVIEAGSDGVHVNTAGNIGFRVDAATANGLQVGSAGNHGVYVGSAFNGIYVNAASGLAGYFGGNVVITGACTGCMQAVFGRNGADTTLEPGTIVSLRAAYAPPDVLAGTPILMEVGPAAPEEAIVGVVVGRAEVEDGDGEEPHLMPREGAAKSGDYVTLLIDGLAQVRASGVAGAIVAGDRLATNEAGTAQRLQTAQVATVDGRTMWLTEDAATVGIALEGLAAGEEGLIWVLVNAH